MPERHTVETTAGTLASQVRAHRFPSLEEGNHAFPQGRYLVDFEHLSDTDNTAERRLAITHRIEGIPFLERLMEKNEQTKRILFVCTISSPRSSFRDTQSSTAARHVIEWDENDLGEPPLFTPMIVANIPFSHRFDSARDGVHSLWNGHAIDFEPGMRLAVSSVIQLRSSVFPLLSFHDDPSLNDGEFCVQEDADGDFSFRINLASDLSKFLRHHNEDPARGHILTHVVSACLAHLKTNWTDDTEDEGWRSYRSLVALSDQLKAQGLPDWCDTDFSPELVATGLYPHKVPQFAIEEVEE